jgi:hypothetical protein
MVSSDSSLELTGSVPVARLADGERAGNIDQRYPKGRFGLLGRQLGQGAANLICGGAADADGGRRSIARRSMEYGFVEQAIERSVATPITA